MCDTELTYLQEIEQHGAEVGWVIPPKNEDVDYLVHFKNVCNRYNIIPSKATRLEYDFVTKVTDSEFYLQQARA